MTDLAGNISLMFMGLDGVPFTISAYSDDNQVANTYLNLDMNQAAITTSPEDAIIPRNCRLVDVVANIGTPVTGQIELISRGHSTGIMLETAMFAKDNAGRPALSVPFSENTQLRVKQIVTGS